MKFFRIFLTVTLLFFATNTFCKGPPPKVVYSIEKSYYLTYKPFLGNEALDGCHDGYHFASAFELIDVSNLTYNVELGKVNQDSGFGPPAGFYGWLRSGTDWYGPNNCENWSEAGTETGLVGALPTSLGYEDPSTDWIYKSEQCGDGAYVWCVSDPIVLD
jgi:hypothetical protein